MNYPRIFERVYCQPLCVHAARFQSIHAFLLPRLAGKMPFEVTAQAAPVTGYTSPAPPAKDAYSGRRRQTAGPTRDARGNIDPRFYTEAKPGVAVVPVYGALAKNLSSWEEMCGGGTDINGIQEALRQAASDDSISKIILDIDSPGGEVTGIPEFGAQVAAAAQQKPVYAFTDAMMASAAYWLGSQATEIYATPSSSLGSIGTYLAWLDETVKMQLEGISLQIFKEGEYKGMGMPGLPLTESHKAYLQGRVKAINDTFQAAVRSKRPDVMDDTMEGQTFSGTAAARNGLADGVVGSFDELLELV